MRFIVLVPLRFYIRLVVWACLLLVVAWIILLAGVATHRDSPEQIAHDKAVRQQQIQQMIQGEHRHIQLDQPHPFR